MKLNKILMALSAMAIVGCSSEDFNDPSVAQAIDDSSLVQLGENFILAGVGEDGNTMRTHWEQNATTKALYNVFLPIWATAPTGGNLIYDATTGKDAKLDEQAVGLCWLGNGTVGTDVYTNYEFYHFGWLKTGETSPVFECNDLKNGAMYNEINVAAGDAAGAEADPTKFSFAGGVTKSFLISDLNYNSGIYKTDNKAIFGGKYIVYYPFNDEFKDAGTIPAKAMTNWTDAPKDFKDPLIGKETFRYSAPVDIKGGDQAAGFGLYNLSAIAQLRLAAHSSMTGKQIDKIVLYSAKEQLLERAYLAADKIDAGEKGTNLYKATEGTKTIVATFATPVTMPATGQVSGYITVLPTTVEDLVVFVHNSTDGTWAKYSMPSTEFKAGNAQIVSLSPKAGNFKTDYYAVDDATLNTALSEARTAIGGTTAKKTITVIGDITLKTVANINATQDPYITIKGDKIIVPENMTLTLNTNLESDLQILGKSCCSNSAWTGGRVVVQGGTLNNVTMEKTEANATTPALYNQYNPEVTYSGAATIAAGKTFEVKAGNVQVDAAVQHKGNINIAEGVKLTVSSTGDLNFMGSTVVNDGTIEVEKAGKFDMTDKDGNATASDGKRMTNNGEFIHNVDAAVGTAVQSMNQNGTYRCRVDKQIKLDDAYQKWLACSVIEMVGAGQTYNLGVAEKNIEYKHNGKFIDIEVNTTSLTTFNNPDLGSGDGDNKNIQVGKLTVMQGGLYLNYVKGEGKRELTVNGDMTVSAKSSLFSSKNITVKENLKVEGAELIYCGKKQNEGGLAVTKDITVSGAAGVFNADGIDALDITCANFTLADAATAKFGNRTNGDTKNLTVSGTISNPAGCTFSIHAANQEAGSVLATITCKKLTVGGSFPGGKPQVVE